MFYNIKAYDDDLMVGGPLPNGAQKSFLKLLLRALAAVIGTTLASCANPLSPIDDLDLDPIDPVDSSNWRIIFSNGVTVDLSDPDGDGINEHLEVEFPSAQGTHWLSLDIRVLEADGSKTFIPSNSSLELEDFITNGSIVYVTLSDSVYQDEVAKSSPNADILRDHSLPVPVNMSGGSLIFDLADLPVSSNAYLDNASIDAITSNNVYAILSADGYIAYPFSDNVGEYLAISNPANETIDFSLASPIPESQLVVSDKDGATLTAKIGSLSGNISVAMADCIDVVEVIGNGSVTKLSETSVNILLPQIGDTLALHVKNINNDKFSGLSPAEDKLMFSLTTDGTQTIDEMLLSLTVAVPVTLASEETKFVDAENLAWLEYKTNLSNPGAIVRNGNTITFNVSLVEINDGRATPQSLGISGNYTLDAVHIRKEAAADIPVTLSSVGVASTSDLELYRFDYSNVKSIGIYSANSATAALGKSFELGVQGSSFDCEEYGSALDEARLQTISFGGAGGELFSGKVYISGLGYVDLGN